MSVTHLLILRLESGTESYGPHPRTVLRMMGLTEADTAEIIEALNSGKMVAIRNFVGSDNENDSIPLLQAIPLSKSVDKLVSALIAEIDRRVQEIKTLRQDAKKKGSVYESIAYRMIN